MRSFKFSRRVRWESGTLSLDDRDFLTLDNIEGLLQILLERPFIECVSISNAPRGLPKELLERLCQLRLTSLVLRGAHMTAQSAVLLAAGLPSSLRTLNLSYNPIRDEGAAAIAQLLTRCSGLIALDLGNTEIGHDGCMALATAIKTGKTTLRSLDLSDNEFRDQSTLELCKALEHSTIERVSLSWNRISSEEVCEALSKCKGLLHVNLGYNLLGDKRMVHIANLIRDTKVVDLCLEGNGITGQGLKDLAIGIKQSVTLQHLNLSNNGLIQSNDGASELMLALRCHTSMYRVYMFGIGFTQEVRLDIRERLENLHSSKARVMVAIMANRSLPRLLAARSPFKLLDRDLLRRLGEMLPPLPSSDSVLDQW
jgi:hypothetical protein